MTAPSSPSARNATEAVQGIADAMRAAWNSRDARAFAACFSEDAEFTNVFGMYARGRPEIERTHALIFNSVMKDSEWTKSQLRIRPIRPDVAAVDIIWEMLGCRDAKGNPWSPRQGIINFIAAENNGAWSIQVFHNMDLPPQERRADAAALWKESV